MRLSNSPWRRTVIYLFLAISFASFIVLILFNPPREIYLAAFVILLLLGVLAYLQMRQSARSMNASMTKLRELVNNHIEDQSSATTSNRSSRLLSFSTGESQGGGVQGKPGGIHETFNSMVAAVSDRMSSLSDDRDKLQAILATMADAVIVISPRGAITILNPAAENLLGAKTADASGRHFVEVFRDPDLHNLISRCLETREAQHGELELLHYHRYLSAEATPMHEHGSTGVLLTLHDLTEMRQAETTRREFVSNVSHELRNPLSSIKAMVETLEDGAQEDTVAARDFLARIHKDVDRMVTMVNDLLELSRLESGQETLRLLPTDLQPLLNESIAQFQSAAKEKGVMLSAELPEKIPLVLGESARLYQVMINLLDNALKFTPAPGKITVSAAIEERFIRVQVSDTGIGIAPEHMPHIFERFYKVDRSRHDGGVGLGLAIVKHIIKAHGGEVNVQSQEGVGSTFSFTLPQA